MALSLGGLAAASATAGCCSRCSWGLPSALVAYALAPTLALAAVAIFFVGLLYLGCLSSFTTIAQLARAGGAPRPGDERATWCCSARSTRSARSCQGAIADEIGLRDHDGRRRGRCWRSRSWSASGCSGPGFDRELGDTARADATEA